MLTLLVVFIVDGQTVHTKSLHLRTALRTTVGFLLLSVVSLDVNPQDEISLLVWHESAGDDAVLASRKPHPESKHT